VRVLDKIEFILKILRLAKIMNFRRHGKKIILLILVSLLSSSFVRAMDFTPVNYGVVINSTLNAAIKPCLAALSYLPAAIPHSPSAFGMALLVGSVLGWGSGIAQVGYHVAFSGVVLTYDRITGKYILKDRETLILSIEKRAKKIIARDNLKSEIENEAKKKDNLALWLANNSPADLQRYYQREQEEQMQNARQELQNLIDIGMSREELVALLRAQGASQAQAEQTIDHLMNPPKPRSWMSALRGAQGAKS